jgi:hypothetical protein
MTAEKTKPKKVSAKKEISKRKPQNLPPCALEKPFWKSKKFIAYMTAEIGWKAVLFMMIYLREVSFEEAPVMLTIILVSGFVQVTFIGGQAALDKYVRVAQIIHGNKQPQKESPK